MSNSARGITLMETLFSLFLSALIMSALASTLSSAGSVSRNRQEMDQAVEVFHVLSLISADASAELDVLSPSSGSSSPALALRRVNPRLNFLARTDASGGGDEMDPYEVHECVDVVYQIEDDHLVRTTTVPGDPGRKERLILAEEFNVSRLGVGGTLIDIEITLSGQRVDKKRRMRVALR